MQGTARGPGRGRRGGRRNKARKFAPLLAVLFLLAVVGGGGYLGYATLSGLIRPGDYDGSGTGSVTAHVHDGDSLSLIGARLEQAGVVKSAKAFLRVAANDARATSIQPGYYHLRLHMSAKAALALLLDPASRAGRLTIPEGKRVADILVALSKKTHIPLKDFQRAARDTAVLGLPPYANGVLEGYLYPFTYDPSPTATATDVLREMVTRFKQVAADIDIEGQARNMNMSPHDIVTIASLIQAESGSADDMPKVSRVIYNRLRNPQPYLHKLQLDSTVMYGLGKYGIVATANDLRSTSPYNTYKYSGLPPGAIANPGEAAVRAALKPAAGTWVYFVTTDPSRRITKFTASHDEFLKFRQELQQNLRHG